MFASGAAGKTPGGGPARLAATSRIPFRARAPAKCGLRMCRLPGELCRLLKEFQYNPFYAF